jgi:hypothetical protein
MAAPETMELVFSMMLPHIKIENEGWERDL